MFKQMEGGPIGLRGTCTIARLVMQCFDRRWMTVIEESGMRIELYTRYMDDGRALLHPVKKGWRWIDGGLTFCRRWELEDEKSEPLDLTVEAMKMSMSGIMDYLKFTYETKDDFGDGWLPTLDTSLMVTKNNQVHYRYYEKPTTTNTVIRKESAMS